MVQCKNAIVGATIHYINEDFKLANLVLVTKEVNELHSGRLKASF